MISKLSDMKDKLNQVKIKEAVEKEKKIQIEKELKELGFEDIDNLNNKIEKLNKEIMDKEFKLTNEINILSKKINDLGR